MEHAETKHLARAPVCSAETRRPDGRARAPGPHLTPWVGPTSCSPANTGGQSADSSLSVRSSPLTGVDPNDPAEWLPAVNQCWYVNRVIQVRLEYNLTIDQTEAAAIDTVLAGCDSTEMVMVNHGVTITATAHAQTYRHANPDGRRGRACPV